MSLAQLKRAFRWDSGSLRWRAPSGRFVSQAALKSALSDFAARAAAEVQALARSMSVGELAIGEWQEATALQLKGLHLSMQAAARGGFARLTQADYGRIGAMLRRQYGYLQRFALQVESGLLTPARIVQRATLYVNASLGTYENERRVAAVEAFAEERRVLHSGESCPDCIAAAAAGWVAAGTLPQITDSICRVNCLCSFEFRGRRDGQTA